MSNETKDLKNHHYTSSYHHYNNNNININLPYVSGASTYNVDTFSSQIGSDLYLSPHVAFESGFELSPSSTEFFQSLIDQENGFYNAYSYNDSQKGHEVVGGGTGSRIQSENRVCASPSSNEVNHSPGEGSGKNQRKREASDGEQDDQSSQKLRKTKKQKEARVSFMTKTEVDHLEDGYRWRKYGQKAVKNSPYPRSYYRCTTQKCNVKKRVERSYQDPTVVITTYESQHNHPIPTNHRTAMFPGPAASDYNSSSSDVLFRVPYAGLNVNPNYRQQPKQEFHHESDYELLKEMFPSVFFKQEP